MKLTSWAGMLVLLAGGSHALAATAPAGAQSKTAARSATSKTTADSAKVRTPDARPPAAADRDAATVEALKDSAWRITCDTCDRREFAPYFVFLRADGQVGSNLGAPAEWNYVSWPATWRVRDGELQIEWAPNDVQTYALATLADRLLVGVNSDNHQLQMVRVVAAVQP